MRLLLLFSLLGILFTTANCATSRNRGTDQAWYGQEEFGSIERPPIYKGTVRTSRYITMRDGVKIAIDLYLPKGLPAGTRIPAIVMQTRYVRGMNYRWPFSLFLHSRFKPMIEYFVTRGYAWVYVDARGSGASFGTRAYPYTPAEIRDGMEVADWILSQSWSDGTIGSLGSSYTGDSAIFLLSTQHPAVKAILPRYAFFDAYPEVLRPGGVHLIWLTEIWGGLGQALDTDTLGDFLGNRVKVALKGTRPVDEDRDGSMLAAAIEEHAGNGDVAANCLDIEYRDDVSPALGVTVDEISPFGKLWEIQKTGAPIYCYTGWFDASYVLSEINFYRSLETPDKRLIIGPWDHGGWQNISPCARSRKTEFNHEAEALRFFDARLRGVDNGFDEEKPVTYYTMGEEKWKFTDTWPPPGTETVPFYFAGAHDLSTSAPATPEGYDTCQFDYSAGTGTRSRWVSLVNPLHEPIEYPDRKEQDEKLLYYTSAPLEAPMEVTGHPIVTLYVSSTADDGAFFVYLEDVGPDGNVTYITEGVLRAIHRKQSEEKAPYSTVTPYRSFSREDAQPLVPGQVAELVFDLYPTSYQFQKGHAVRVALAGADKDHFAFMPEQPPTVRYYRNAAYPSHIELPVMKAGP